jgi:tetratricopeptide (TPR) repeat protein
MALGIDKGKHIEQAQRYIQKGQIDKAISEYQKVVEADPKELRTRLKIGDLYLKKGDRGAAEEEYSKVAESYTSDGFNLQAIAVYKQLLKIDPSLYDIYTKLADLYKRQGLIADALAQYRIVISNYEKNGKIGEAIDALKKMASLDPENFSIRAKLADLYLKGGRRKEALEEYARIAGDLKGRGRMDDVIILYEKLLTTDPSCADALRGLGEACLAIGKKDEALSRLRDAVKANPDDIKALSLLAETYVELNEDESARLTFEHILRVDPSSVDAMKGLSRILIREGDTEGAVRAVTPAIEKAMEEKGYDNALGILFGFYRDGIREPIILEKMAEVYDLKGEGDKARELRGELADIYESRGEVAEARRIRGEPEAHIEPTVEEHFILEEVRKEAPSEDVSRRLTEAEVYVKYGLKEKAVEILSAAMELFPDNTEVRERLASLGVPSERVEEVVPEIEEVPLEVEEIPELEVVEEAEGYPPSKVRDDIEEAEFYIQQGLYDEAREVCKRILEFYPEHEDTLSKLRAIDEAAQVQVPAAEVPAEEAAGEVFFDLAAELEGEELEGVLAPPGMSEAERFGFEDIFSEFKKGVEAQLGKEDAETHYSLGIAYKEMGLLDDAVREFRIAASDPDREFDCYSLIGICYVEKGSPQKAVEVFKKGLELPGRSDEEYASLSYELGKAYELSGMTAEALAAYMETQRRSPGFRDVESKILSLGGGRGVKKGRVSYV